MHVSRRGFTFIELIIVLAIIGLMFSLVGYQSGSFTFWREEGFIRKFSEQVRFLYTQSVSDQATYQLEIDLKRNTYRVGVVKDDPANDPILAQLQENLGDLSLELAALLNPPISEGQTIIPSPSFPSLYEESTPPNGMKFLTVKTPNGDFSENSGGDSNGKAYLYFYSEWHLGFRRHYLATGWWSGGHLRRESIYRTGRYLPGRQRYFLEYGG